VKVRLGSRGSDLALWQANHVSARLSAAADTEIVVIKTRGDRIQDIPLTSVDGKAFFTAEIEHALLHERVDLAVHSHKDLATEGPEALRVAAVPDRAPAGELLVMQPAARDDDAPLLPLKPGAVVGTSSPRRREQLLALRPDLRVDDLRGNVPTRVGKVREGRYDAIVLARAGVERLELDLSDLSTWHVPVDVLVPAPAQGALAIQIRGADADLDAVCREHLHDEDTAAAVAAERSLLTRAGGGCNLPLGVHVVREDGGFTALGFLGATHPHEDAPPRWARGTGDTPSAATEALWERLSPGEATGEGPLAGFTVTLVGSAGGGTLLGERLTHLGAKVHHEAVITFENVEGVDLAAAVAALSPGDVVAVTSRQAAARLRGVARPDGVRLAAVGPSTAQILELLGHPVDVVGRGGARALAEVLDVESGATVLFPCAETARPDLPDALRARGVNVEPLVVYRTIVRRDAPRAPEAAARVYMSPSAVEAAVELGREPEGDDPTTLRLALGASASEALTRADRAHVAPEGSGPDAALAALVAHHIATRPANAGPRRNA
jgi:hydroxymethylbilane synthase